MSKKKIVFDGTQGAVEGGFVSAGGLYTELKIDLDKHVVFLAPETGVDVPLLPDDHLIIRGGESFKVAPRTSGLEDNPVLKEAVRISINGESVVIDESKVKITADELCKYDPNSVSSPLLYWESGDQNDRYIAGGLVVVVREGDVYIVLSGTAGDVIDLEQCAKDGRKPPSGDFTYRIKIDGEKYDIPKREVTGAEIFEYAGKKYEEWSLNRKLSGGRRVPVEPEQLVDLAESGVERFETVRRQAQQGYDAHRRG